MSCAPARAGGVASQATVPRVTIQSRAAQQTKNLLGAEQDEDAPSLLFKLCSCHGGSGNTVRIIQPHRLIQRRGPPVTSNRMHRFSTHFLRLFAFCGTTWANTCGARRSSGFRKKSKFSEKGATCRGGTIECMSAEGMGSVSSWIVTFRQLHVKFWIRIPIGFVPCLSRKSTNGYNTLRQKDSAARSEAPSARSIVPNPTCIRIRCSHGAM